MSHTASVETSQLPSTASSHQVATNNLALTLKWLADLRAYTDDYDDDFRAPTDEAFEFAWKVIQEALVACPSNVPVASPAPVGDGGIFVQWGSRERYVRLVVTPNPSGAYLYVLGGAHPGGQQTVTSAMLAKHLQELSLDPQADAA
jgi:hypothetical protein